MISVAPSSAPPPKKGLAIRRSKRVHEYHGGKHCSLCGVKKTWAGARGPCPPKVRT